MSQQDYFIEFARELGNLNGNLTAVLKRIEERMAKNDEIMSRHEARLSTLEDKERWRASSHRPNTEADEPLKNWIIKALIRIIGWGTVIVGSLVGAGELLKSVHIG